MLVHVLIIPGRAPNWRGLSVASSLAIFDAPSAQRPAPGPAG